VKKAAESRMNIPIIEPLIALLSGGLDSSLMAWRAIELGARVHPLYVRQGTLWQDHEEEAARGFAAALTRLRPGMLDPLTVLRLELPPGYVSRWAVDPAVAPPDAATPDEAVDLPGKNLALLIMAAMLAQSLAVRRIQIGLLSTNPFKDAQPEFLDGFAKLYGGATGYALRIERPLAGLAKEALIREGRALPLELTFSCLRPVGDRHCGRCNKCAERQQAFARAGVEDRTRYESKK
jgi:7-cyano-7-deazaguanine synthase